MRHARTSGPAGDHRRGLLLALATVACAVALGACGSSSTPPGGAGAGRVAQGIRYSACMRANGLPKFPDPSGGVGGIQIQISSGINPASPAFQAAQTRCSKLLPGGGPGQHHPSEQDITQMRQTSVCMRAHGITGFPDPTLTPPANPAGYGSVMDRGGVVIAIPDTIDTGSPAFLKAATACGFPH
jgi:hypothetical protein